MTKNKRIDEIDRRQKELLRSCKRPDSEWVKDIIWLKRLDVVSDLEDQKKADILFRRTIKEQGLYTKDFRHIKLISAPDNLWQTKDIDKKNWYEE